MADSARALLDAAYAHLGYEKGALYPATSTPDAANAHEWVDKGDWLALAEKVGAEKVFFVNDYPVAIFAEQKSSDPSAWVHHFNSVWCMARPQLLFLAREGELAVLNLTSAPARLGDQRQSDGRLLDVVEEVILVQTALAKFRREQIESGRLFEEERFGSGDRADRALIRDLGRVRKALIDDGLSAGYAHALIGRSIFVRYLEDRGVLTEEYFLSVARSGKAGDRDTWQQLLRDDVTAENAVQSKGSIYYPRTLRNKLFTYRLFERLSKDFNGDIFPVDDEEEMTVTEKHLGLLRKFLLGGMDGGLFFFAYRFDIIPIELISSIYEKFYSLRTEKQREDGSYYTPAALVDFVLTQTLSGDLLEQKACVLDPACGSGIFLVESFRRIVRHRCRKPGTKLSSDDLREILRDQIRGIDINREAIRVAAFSLYLAMLHYLEPPDILQNKLPSLTYVRRKSRDPERHLDILLVSDAFGVAANLADRASRKRFGAGSVNVVVGNPPWGAPKTDDELSSDGGTEWCADRGLPVGDKERSQSFIHRALDFLAPGGRAGLLISTGVFFKRHDKTRAFRQKWLGSASLRSVVNFAAVRDAFFRVEGGSKDEGRGAIAPFASVVFDKGPPSRDNYFSYWSAKETAFVTRIQAVILNRADFRHAPQSKFVEDDSLWKIYWWGTHRDEALIGKLRLESTLGREFDSEGDNFRIGFLKAKKDQIPSGWLRKFKEFPTRVFVRYGALPTQKFKTPPPKVKRRCEKDLFQGPRLLVKRGIGSDGVVVARYENENFSFRHSIYGIVIPQHRADEAKLALGFIWSSLTQYYLFMTSGTWGLWHDEVLKETYANIPLRLSLQAASSKRILSAVDKLRAVPVDDSIGPLFEHLTATNRAATVRELEAELNEAVFDAFGLAADERTRVVEFCSLGLDLFYRGMKSDAVKPMTWPPGVPQYGRVDDLSDERMGKLAAYLKAFLAAWEPNLREQSGRFRWRVVRPDDPSAMAVMFETEAVDEPLTPPTMDDKDAWNDAIQRLQATARHPVSARQLYVDGLVRIVTDTDILICKRNEQRLWTASAALEDAEATMLMMMVPTVDLNTPNETDAHSSTATI